jgi:hypothetical protein
MVVFYAPCEQHKTGLKENTVNVSILDIFPVLTQQKHHNQNHVNEKQITKNMMSSTLTVKNALNHIQLLTLSRYALKLAKFTATYKLNESTNRTISIKAHLFLIVTHAKK